MRSYQLEVYKGFTFGQPTGKPGGTLWTDGTTIFSYHTALARAAISTDDENIIILNTTRYSKTTTENQRRLLKLFREDFRYADVVKVTNVPRDTSAAHLLRIARELPHVN